MNKTIKKEKTTIAVLIILIIILSISAIGLTYAFFTDRETTESQVIKFGKIDIDVSSNVYKSGTTQVVSELMPGDSLDIKYTLANAENSESAWVLTYVNLNSPSLTEAELQQFSSINGWYEGSTKAQANSCLALSKGNTGTDYTIKLSISKSLSNELKEKYLILEVFTFAIQQANLTEANAYALLQAEYNNYFEELSADTFTLRGTIITGIKDDANTDITDIIIPEGITAIADSDGYFSDFSLETINLPSTMKYIGNCAFAYQCSLNNVNIPNRVEIVGESAFECCCSLTTLNLPDSVKLLKTYAFGDCAEIRELHLGSGIKVIGELAFGYCYGLDGITIPASVTSIGDDAFYYCKALESITVESGNTKYSSRDGVLFDKNKTILIAYPQAKTATSFVVPNTVTSIGDSAFNSCSKLATVTFESGSKLQNIGDAAFGYCTSLESVTIPSSVTSIGGAAFSSCDALSTLNFESGSKLTSIGNSAFGVCDLLESITIPSGVTSIGDGAFGGCSKLATVTFENGSKLTSIGNSAFYNCDLLESITIPSGVTSIGDGAFGGCNLLESITIPSGVTSIGDAAFRYCNMLTKVYYGGSDLAEWNRINIVGNYNTAIKNATKYYYSETNKAGCWHYVNNVPTLW